MKISTDVLRMLKGVFSGSSPFGFCWSVPARFVLGLASFGILVGALLGDDVQATPVAAHANAAAVNNAAAINHDTAYILQPNDEIVFHSIQVKEVADKTFRLDQEGYVNVPLAGRILLAGSTLPQAEELLVSKLRKYYVEPDIQLNVSAQHPDLVSVIGAVNNSGNQPIRSHATLLEALSSAGGVRPDAGPLVIVTRRPEYGPIPHQSSKASPMGENVAEINLKSLMEARDPAENIQVRPRDVISVPPAQVVYVWGNVRRAGGFPLSGKAELSVVQAVALAEGLDPRASPSHARILRRVDGTEQQIAVDLKKVLAGKEPDVTLHPNDILFVPNSATKAVTNRAVEAMIQAGTGFLILH